MNKLSQLAEPLTAVWGRLAPAQKAAVTLLVVLMVVGLGAVASISNRPQYSVLFSNLNSGDAGAIVTKLKELKTDYHLTGGGSTIEVPSKDVYDLRLQLAGAGLPQGGAVGFEIFDKQNFGMTDFTQKLNYQRALQGELSRTIEEIGSVGQARVHLVIAEPNIYSQKQQESSASVVLKLKTSGQLDAAQVSSVQHLVASAVEGMKPASVTVVDSNGNTLSESENGSGGSGLRMSATQLDTQRQYESGVAKDLQAMLDRVVGPGKAMVRVNARMNFDLKQSDSELYQPGNNGRGIIASQDQTDEKYKGAGKPGMASATLPTATLPTATLPTALSPGDNYSRNQTNVKYQVSKTVEHVIQAPGKVERLSIAVLLDSAVGTAAVNTIRQTVSAAAGVDTTRGDQVTVDSLAFDTSIAKADDDAEKKAASREMMLTYGKWCVAVLISLIFLLFFRSFLRGPKVAGTTETFQTPLPLHEMEALELIQAHKTSLQLDITSQDEASPQRIAARRAAEVADEKPEEVAKLLRSWLVEK